MTKSYSSATAIEMYNKLTLVNRGKAGYNVPQARVNTTVATTKG